MGNSSSSSRQSKTNSTYLDVPSSIEPPPYSTYDTPSRSSSRDARKLALGSGTDSRSSSRSSVYSYHGKLDRRYLRAPLRKESLDDVLETLRGYDTVILVDDSLSMSGHRWDEAREALEKLAQMAAQYDSNGIDIHFLNATTSSGENMRDMDQVRKLFSQVEPRAGTPTGRRLEQLLQNYISGLEAADNAGHRQNVKPVNFIVITDGEPSDDPESVIVANARRLDQRNFPLCQVGIQFVQIGNSKRAARHLQELDDNLSSKHGIRDIIDTVPFIGKIEGDMLVKVLVGSINRKIDREQHYGQRR